MKKKFLSFIIAFAFILTAGIFLTACGGGGGNDDDNKQFSGISLEYKDDTYDFNNYAGVRIPYRDGLYFTASDFVIVVHYYNHADDRISATSEYLTIYDFYGQEATLFDVGLYRIEVIYNNTFLTVNFEISGNDIAEAEVTGYNSQYPYEYNGDYNNGVNIEPDVTVTYNGTKLTKDIDYTIRYELNNIISTEQDKAKIVIDGIGKYAGQKTVTFEIVKIELDEVTPIEPIIKKPYNQYSQFDLITNNIPTLSSGFYNYTYNIRYIITKDDQQFYDGFGSTTIRDAGRYEIEYVLPYDEEHFTYNHANPTATLIIEKVDITKLPHDARLELGKTYNGVALTASEIRDSDIGLEWDGAGYKQDLIKGNHFKVTMLDGQYIKDGKIVTETTEGAILVDNLNASVNGKVGALLVEALDDNFTGSIIFTYEILQFNVDYLEISVVCNDSYDGNAHHPTVVVKHAGKPLTKGTDYETTYSDPANIYAGDKTITFKGINNYCGEKVVSYKIKKAQISLQMNDYNFKTTYLPYNGQNLAAELLQIKVSDDATLPSQVEIKFTTGKPYGQEGSVEVTELIEARDYIIYATFVIKADDQSNYELKSGNDYYITQSIAITEAQISVAIDADSSAFDGGSHANTSGDDVYFYYYGTDKTPGVILSGAYGTLVEGVDYKLKFTYMQPTGSYFTETAAIGEIGTYEFTVEMLNPNYKISGTNRFRFEITKKMIAKEEIAWPTVYKLIWTSLAYFDVKSLTTEKSGTFDKTIDGVSVNVTFTLKTLKNSNDGKSWIDDNNQIAITFTAEKYQAEDNIVDVVIVSPFETFILGDKTLSAEEQDALSAEAIIISGTKLKVTVAEGYKMRYTRATSGNGSPVTEFVSGQSLIITDFIDGEKSIDLEVYLADAPIGSSYLAALHFTVQK